jgi:uncharacterized protein YhbP (UPF0306 family)
MKSDQEIERIIREYLPGVIHMSLATTANNKPWVCEVHFSYDDELKLYFISTLARRHSNEIANNSNVAGSIVEQHVVGKKVRGVYFEGTAELLDGVDNKNPAYLTYSERFNLGSDILEEAKTDDGHKFFKISISDLYLFEGRSKPSQKYHLDWQGHNK